MSQSLTSTAVVASPADCLDTLPSGWPEDHGHRTLGFHAWAFTQGLEWDWKRAEWRQRWKGLIQPNGPRSGKVFRPTDRQMRFWLWWYALDDNGRWLFTHGVRRLAKGSGKSPSVAVTGLIEFCGNVRLAQFDERAPGGCVGRPVDMPWIQVAATAESQTVNTMRMVRAFAPKSSPVVGEFGLDPGKTMYYKTPEGKLEIITSSATAAEGAEPSLVIGDQTELWRPSNGGIDLAATLQDNAAKSGARMIETPNAWAPGQGSVAESSWDAWVAQQEGQQGGLAYTPDAGQVLYDAIVAPADVDIRNPDSLKPTLERIYWDCDWKKPHGPDGEPLVDEPPDVSAIMERIWSLTSREDDSRKKYLNQPTVAQDAWVDPNEWALLATKEPVVVGLKEPVVLFFDGSKSRDATALIGCRVDDGHIFTLGVWEPNPNDPDETVDQSDIDRVVMQTFDHHKVVAFFADVREWEQFTLTEWPQRYRDQLSLWASPSSRPAQPVAWDMRGHSYEFAKATEACKAEIVAGAFTHDGDSRVARHVANARNRPYRDAMAIGKESPASPKKIDAAVCVIGARMVRRLYQSAAPSKKRTGVVW